MKVLLGGLCLALCATTLLGFASDWWWGLELLSHFRAQYLALLGLLSLALTVQRRRYLAALALGAAVVNLAVLRPYLPWYEPQPDARPDQLKLVSLNLNSANTRYREVLAFLAHESADVAVLLELTADWEHALASLFPHGVTVARADGFGIGVYSRMPLKPTEIVDLGGYGTPAILTRITTPQGPVRLLGLHLFAPTAPTYLRRRDRQLAALADLVAELPEEPILVSGDFNVTPWSQSFTRLLATSGLKDGSAGLGLGATWPSVFPPLLIPIDHVLLKGPVELTSERVGPYIGSDHYPLVATFRRIGGAHPGL